ncbi:uncharacterized protein BDZ99DRAFT_481902 [Mytilinidion resinicola]|uniref:Uncharacterized protein n=1 Tax=Mytilinidion resinicola TaxID=574789 RepID=A0A6A6Y4B0_9PEZI|nr:uncharacterized protein BDZ99DRAFT_481902 [Mytilinidion resinicola]KAF2803469.1 hypothetical protein BDZ99DRAFT_481902 [Mytilinidion resinicola]
MSSRDQSQGAGRSQRYISLPDPIEEENLLQGSDDDRRQKAFQMEYQMQKAYQIEDAKRDAELRQREHREALQRQAEEAYQDNLHWTGAGWDQIQPVSPKPPLERVRTLPESHNPWDAYSEALSNRREEMAFMKTMKRLMLVLLGKDVPPLPPKPQRP